jgi:hypothetical protein
MVDQRSKVGVELPDRNYFLRRHAHRLPGQVARVHAEVPIWAVASDRRVRYFSDAQG